MLGNRPNRETGGNVPSPAPTRGLDLDARVISSRHELYPLAPPLSMNVSEMYGPYVRLFTFSLCSAFFTPS